MNIPMFGSGLLKYHGHGFERKIKIGLLAGEIVRRGELLRPANLKKVQRLERN